MLRTTLTVSLFTLIACGTDTPRPRIATVETECYYEFDRTSERYEVTYDGDHIASIREVDVWDNEPRLTELDLSYSEDRITRVSIVEEDETADLEFAYSDGVLDSATATYCDGECDTAELFYTYVDGRLSTEEWTEDGYVTSWEYRWSGDQLSQITNTWGDEGGFDYVDFSYDPEGRLQRATSRFGDVVSFRFNDGHLDSLSDAGGYRWELEYDDDGLISEIVRTSSHGTRCVTNYTYEAGEVAGIVPVPALPYGNRFDMAGQTLRDYPVLTTALFID